MPLPIKLVLVFGPMLFLFIASCVWGYKKESTLIFYWVAIVVVCATGYGFGCGLKEFIDLFR